MWDPKTIRDTADSIVTENNLPKHFCILPWAGIETRTDSRACVCCVMQEPIEDVDLRVNTISDAWNSQHLAEIRQSFLTGTARESCSNCWHEENSGIVSRRQQELYRYKDRITDLLATHDYPTYVDLKLGNICNSKCRICTSFASSKWAKEQIDQGSVSAKDHLIRGRWPRENTKFWQDLENNIEHITSIDMFGGEPLMIQEHIRVLERCVEKGVANNISLSYNTNGTIYNPDLIAIWKEFKEVQLLFSIDGIGERFNYLRYPGLWNEVEANIHRYKKHTKIGLFCTISAFNIWYIPEVCDWAAAALPDVDLHFNKVFEPKHYSTKCLPVNVKQRVREHLQKNNHYEKIRPWVDFMFTEDYDCWDEHIAQRNASDNYRGESYAATFKEFYEVQNG
jgi:MoaA/NifB/PqqE/SkfB family radical SAM enzyme